MINRARPRTRGVTGKASSLLLRAADAVAFQEVSKLDERVVDSSLFRATKRRKYVSETSGTAQLSELMRLLDCAGMSRSPTQKQLHLGMAGCVLQRIFTDDSEADMKLAMRMHRIRSSKQQFMAVTPRRFGKSTAVSIFVAAFALSVLGSTTAIFSTGRRASSLLLKSIKKMLIAMPGGEQRILSDNVETITIDCGGSRVSTISSFPGKART
jgi:acetylglutamate synthase